MESTEEVAEAYIIEASFDGDRGHVVVGAGWVGVGGKRVMVGLGLGRSIGQVAKAFGRFVVGVGIIYLCIV